MLVTLDSSTLDAFVSAPGASVLLWRMAPRGPSHSMVTALQLLSRLHPEVRFGAVDMRHEPLLCRQWQVTEAPTLMLHRDGLLLFMREGAMPMAAVEALVNAALNVDMSQARAGSDGQGGRLELVPLAQGGGDDPDDDDDAPASPSTPN